LGRLVIDPRRLAAIWGRHSLPKQFDNPKAAFEGDGDYTGMGCFVPSWVYGGGGMVRRRKLFGLA